MKKWSDAGAGGVVLKSVFEEQIQTEIQKLEQHTWMSGHTEAFDYVRGMGMALGPKEYLTLIEEAKRVEAVVEYRGKTGKCPECGKRCAVYDRAPKRQWRHLDACGYEMIVICSLPRVECSEHKVKTLS